MKKPLWKIIKEIEEKNGLADYYLHYDYDTGDLQLNIEFNNDVADKILKESNIAKIGLSAYWE